MAHQQDRGISGEQLAKGLALFSIGLGLAESAAPRSVARAIGLGSSADSGTLQAFGAREIGNGLAILAQPDNPAWLWTRVGGDALDLSYLAARFGDGSADRGRLTSALAAVLGVTALDVLCALRLRSNNGANASDRGYATRRGHRNGFRVERVATIRRPIEEVYQYWRRFENLPRFMRHLESVETLPDGKTRWRAKGPAGVTVEWMAELLQDRANEWIAWRSIPGSDIDNSGSVRFSHAPAGRGTEVRVQLQYLPPAGTLGRTIARLFGEEPDQQIHEDLHRFKQLMETGEVPVSDGPSLRRPAQPPRDPAELRELVGVQP
jgi:uncharacterized membrane protein